MYKLDDYIQCVTEIFQVSHMLGPFNTMLQNPLMLSKQGTHFWISSVASTKDDQTFHGKLLLEIPARTLHIKTKEYEKSPYSEKKQAY